MVIVEICRIIILIKCMKNILELKREPKIRKKFKVKLN